MKKLAYAAFLLLLAGCANDAAKAPADQITFNDFEAVEGYTNGAAVPSLTKERAHSGTFAIRVANGVDYSLGYMNLLGKMSPTRLRKIKIQAWVYVPSAQANCVLVTQVRNLTQDKDIFWDGLDLTKTAKGVNKWVLVEKEVTLPETATYADQLLIYMWRGNSPQPTYLDDLRITRVDS